MEYMIILGVGIVCTIIGVIAGYVLGNSRDDQPETETQAESTESEFPADAIHIWRDSTSQQLILQIGSHVARAPEPFSPTEQKYIGHLINQLQNWVGIETPPTPPHPAKQPVPDTHQNGEPGQGSVSPFVSEPAEAIPTAAKSIVSQIDDILQEKLSNSPLIDRGIRLMESIDGGMVIYVGLEQYKDIDTIPDEKIIAIIRAAVQDWEQRQ